MSIDGSEQCRAGTAVGVGADLGGLHALEEILEDLGAHKSADDAGAAEGEGFQAGEKTRLA